MNALWCLESQIESYWYKENFVDVSPVPIEPEARALRKQEFIDQCLWKPVWSKQADQYRELIQRTYGAEIATHKLSMPSPLKFVSMAGSRLKKN